MFLRKSTTLSLTLLSFPLLAIIMESFKQKILNTTISLRRIFYDHILKNWIVFLLIHREETSPIKKFSNSPIVSLMSQICFQLFFKKLILFLSRHHHYLTFNWE